MSSLVELCSIVQSSRLLLLVTSRETGIHIKFAPLADWLGPFVTKSLEFLAGKQKINVRHDCESP